MPIRINLLAEAHEEEELRRRDPVKRSLVGGVLLVAIFLVWFSAIFADSMWASRQLSQLDNEIQVRTNEFSQVIINQEKVKVATRRLEALQKFSSARFLQGNLMEALQKTYVPNVSITRLRVEQNYAQTPGSPSVTNKAGVIPGRSGASTERVLLTIDAKDSSANPGDQVNRFKEALAAQDYLKSMMDKTNSVRLSAPPSAPQSIADGKPFVTFTLECRFADKTR
jgi:hypothetical protein